jgi:hypothetical protein
MRLAPAAFVANTTMAGNCVGIDKTVACEAVHRRSHPSNNRLGPAARFQIARPVQARIMRGQAGLPFAGSKQGFTVMDFPVGAGLTANAVSLSDAFAGIP